MPGLRPTVGSQTQVQGLACRPGVEPDLEQRAPVAVAAPGEPGVHRADHLPEKISPLRVPGDGPRATAAQRGGQRCGTTKAPAPLNIRKCADHAREVTKDLANH
jgi:hypothetical protein